MAQNRTFLDRSAAQKLVDPAIRRAIDMKESSDRIETARAEATVLGALPVDEDIDIYEIRRQAEENTKRRTLLQQKLLEQEDQRIQYQQMKHRLDELMTGLNSEGTLPDVTRAKEETQAQRLACLQYLANTKRDATQEEKSKFPELVAAVEQPDRLIPNEAHSEEKILWALGSENAMIQDSWNVEEVFEALVIARKEIEKLKELNSQLVDNLPTMKSDLQKIDSSQQRLENKMQEIVSATGSDPKRRRPSNIDVQSANLAGTSITRPSTAPPARPSRIVSLPLPRSGAFNQIPRSVQTSPLGISSSSVASPGQPSPSRSPAVQSAVSPQFPEPAPPSAAVIAERTALGVARLPSEVTSRLGVWIENGKYEKLEDKPLTGEALTAFHQQLQESRWCTAEDDEFNGWMRRDVLAGAVCMWGRLFRGEKSSQSQEREVACYNCIDRKRFCFSKLGKQFGRHPVLLPLPVTMRVGKERDDIGYWKVE
ncbi:hypothetical protein KCU78_g2783, partial [Aureobasidium melanogenum]